MGKKQLPNIIFLLCDTLGAKHLSLYGYHRATTPNVERIVEQGQFAVYKRCFSPASWTIPSHASFFTGLYPSEHGVDDDHVYFPDNYYCLAEILKNQGYRTYGVSANGLVSRLLNFDRGFDAFYEMWHLFNSKDFFAPNQLFGRSKKQVEGELQRFALLLKITFSNGNYLFTLKKMVDTLYKKIYGIPQMIDKSSLATLRAFWTSRMILAKTDPHTPFFLFLNVMEAHNQYNPPRKYNHFIKIDSGTKKRLMEKYEWQHYALAPFSREDFELLTLLYDQEVLFLDTLIGNFYSFLEERNLLKNTIFIIASDHGELIGEHGHCSHMFTLYNELLHVPLIFRYPHDFGIHGEISRLVQLHDIFATILEIVESPFPVPDSSQSLLSAPREFAVSESIHCNRPIRKLKTKNPSFILQEFMQPYNAVITKDMLKIIRRADGQTELFDLNSDLYETHELSDSPAYAQQKMKLLQFLEEV